jgi:hypothetical protein
MLRRRNGLSKEKKEKKRNQTKQHYALPPKINQQNKKSPLSGDGIRKVQSLSL